MRLAVLEDDDFFSSEAPLTIKGPPVYKANNFRLRLFLKISSFDVLYLPSWCTPGKGYDAKVF